MTRSFFEGSLTVVEIGERRAAGAAGSLLAQLGCRVIQIEPTGGAGRPDGKWAVREQFTAGKLGLVLDPGSRADAALASRLAAQAEIVLTSTDVDRFTVEVDTVAAVHCDVTAFGRDGPLAGQAYTDTQVQALTGMLDTTGMPDAHPLPVGGDAAEFAAGLYAVAAVLAAARVLRTCGRGQAVDMALFDCAFSCVSTFLPRYLMDRSATVRRAGNRHPMTGPWNVFAARDGWALVCTANDAQWQRLCAIMERPDLAADERYATATSRMGCMDEIEREIAAWVARRTVAECVSAFDGTNVASGPIAPMDGYPREANLEHRRMILALPDPVSGTIVHLPASPVKGTHSSGLDPSAIPAPDAGRAAALAWLSEAERRPRRPAPAASTPARLPLDGIRVLEIGHYTTAPLGARHLSSLGAEVIKIEPRGGEGMRAWSPAQAGQGVFFTYTNTDKRSIALDLGTAPGAEIFRRLVASADVLVENLKPGALERRGLGWDSLSAINPRLVYCAISGFGEDTIYAGRAAFDTVIQAMCGLMAINLSDGVPVKAGISSADLMGAQLSVVNVLAALEARERTGRGERFDLAMQDVAAWATQTAWNGEAGAPRVTPVRLLECSDGLVAVERAEDLPQEAASCELTRTACAERLRERGLAAAAVLSVPEAVEHPQTRARGLVFSAGDRRGLTWPMLASPLRLALTPPRVKEPMCELGRDTEAILAELGVDLEDPGVQAATAAT